MKGQMAGTQIWPASAGWFDPWAGWLGWSVGWLADWPAGLLASLLASQLEKKIRC